MSITSGDATAHTLPNGAHALLVTRNREILLVQKGPHYTFDLRNAGKVGMFGGGIEVGETREAALERELREELEFDITNLQTTFLNTFKKTAEQDGASCLVHVFVVYDVDPDTLVLHEGVDEKPGPTETNASIVQGTPEALLTRTDLTRITRLALEQYVDKS